jgi:hypothetical protein
MNEISNAVDALERLRMWTPEDPSDLEGMLTGIPRVAAAAGLALAGISDTISATNAHESYPERIAEAAGLMADAAGALDGMSLMTAPGLSRTVPSRVTMPPRTVPPRPANAAAPWVPGPPPLPGLARHPSLPRRDQDQPREAPRVTMTLRERRKRTRRAIRRIRRGL